MWQNGHGAIGHSVRESDRTEPIGGNTDRKSLRTNSVDALADEELGGIGSVVIEESRRLGQLFASWQARAETATEHTLTYTHTKSLPTRRP